LAHADRGRRLAQTQPAIPAAHRLDQPGNPKPIVIFGLSRITPVRSRSDDQVDGDQPARLNSKDICRAAAAVFRTELLEQTFSYELNAETSPKLDGFTCL
jgi:hypothetical protein